jgi:hypothetical protein
MSINGGSKEFWEEIFHLFAKHNGTRVNYKGKDVILASRVLGSNSQYL